MTSEALAAPGVAFWLSVRPAPLLVGAAPLPHRSVCRRPLSWSQVRHPMKHPWLYQKLAWPLLHASPVMLAQVCSFTLTK